MLQRAREKVEDQRADLRGMGFQREMPGIEQMHISVGKIIFVRERTGRDEGWIVSAPNRQQRWLVAAEISVERGVGLDVLR